MNSFQITRTVEIVYFSGTGGTLLVARQFADSLRAHNISVETSDISPRTSYEQKPCDLLLILYPVYAANAPEPIYHFISKLSKENTCAAVVISVSGGGEITPNTACRLHAIKRLEKQGYPVVYEHMIVMPSNFVIATPDELSYRLLEILPHKVERIVNDLLLGITRKTKPTLLNRLVSFLGEFEKLPFAGKSFALHIIVQDNCNGCGLCANSCPAKNIHITNNLPVFSKNCLLCLKCIYDCPKGALKATMAKFIVLKQGYSLKNYEAEMNTTKTHTIDELAKGYALSGIKKYLKEDL
ncbi:MAG: EFR1 family ferrodoxin [Mobilitalea sp.]